MFTNMSGPEVGIFLIALLLAVSLHEAMHGFAAYWLGDDTAEKAGRLTLNPLKHLDIFTSILMPFFLVVAGLPPFFIAKPVPFNPWRVKYAEFGAAIIGIAGPATNLVLATIASIFIKVIGVDFNSELFNAMYIFIQINVALFVFNLIPFPPLDGSRVLYAFAPEPLQKVMQRIESFGIGAIFIFLLVLLPLLGPFVVNANKFMLEILLF